MCRCRFWNKFDFSKQDSNSEVAKDEDETTDILDTFDGEEIELMFTQDYEEDIEDQKRNWKKWENKDTFALL